MPPNSAFQLNGTEQDVARNDFAQHFTAIDPGQESLVAQHEAAGELRHRFDGHHAGGQEVVRGAEVDALDVFSSMRRTAEAARNGIW